MAYQQQQSRVSLFARSFHSVGEQVRGARGIRSFMLYRRCRVYKSLFGCRMTQDTKNRVATLTREPTKLKGQGGKRGIHVGKNVVRPFLVGRKKQISILSL